MQTRSVLLNLLQQYECPHTLRPMKTKTMPSELSAADLIKYLNSRKGWHGKQYRALCGQWLRKAESEKEILDLRSRLMELESAIVEFAGDIEPRPHHTDSLLRLIEISRENRKDQS